MVNPYPLTVASTDLTDTGDLVERARWHEEQAAEHLRHRDEIKAVIQERLGRAELGVANGRPVVRWSHHNRRAFDQSRFRTDHPDLWASYQTETPYRRFTWVDPTEDTHQTGPEA